MESMPVPKKAVEKARNRHELSSGMMRRTTVAPWDGSGTSGTSIFDTTLRLRDSGLESAWLEAVEPLLRAPVPLKDGLSGGFGVDLSDASVTRAASGLTISCSPSSSTPISASLLPGLWSLSGSAFGGYPYRTSKSGIEVFSIIWVCRSPTVASFGKIIVACPAGPRIRIRIQWDVSR